MGTLKRTIMKLRSHRAKKGIQAKDHEALFMNYMMQKRRGDFKPGVILIDEKYVDKNLISEFESFIEPQEQTSALTKYLQVVIGERYLMEQGKDISVKEAANLASEELVRHIDNKMDQMMSKMQQSIIMNMRALFEETINMTLLSMAEGIRNFAPVGKQIIADALMESMTNSLINKGVTTSIPQQIPDMVYQTSDRVAAIEVKKEPRKLEIPRDKGGRIKWSVGKEAVFAVLQHLENEGINIDTAKNVNDHNPSIYVQIKRVYKGDWEDMIKEYRDYVNN
jgi:hypothetical protein